MHELVEAGHDGYGSGDEAEPGTTSPVTFVADPKTVTSASHSTYSTTAQATAQWR